MRSRSPVKQLDLVEEESLRYDRVLNQTHHDQFAPAVNNYPTDASNSQAPLSKYRETKIIELQKR